ncbi:MAG: hypothetical protein HC913_11120 [Microscillaceae bacterium]|nr:hypothetical protein [Microscillaceae bacterium]
MIARITLIFIMVLGLLGTLNAQVAEPSTSLRRVAGKVHSRNQYPLAGIKILPLGLRGVKAVETDAQGNFQLYLPEDVELAKQEFIAFDASLSRLNLDYKVALLGGGELDFCVEWNPVPVRQVQLYDLDQKPLAGIELLIDGQRYQADAAGKIILKHQATDFSAFRADALQIAQLKFLRPQSLMQVYLYETDNASLAMPLLNTPGNRLIQTTKSIY